ncbi:putative cyclic nucleotide-gated ion channel 7 [Turnera subulata]|uniref:Cyclic nucleotide-gated ion channel 7 n=1 Tax=Turnera subulata TaxID=218843 RepID=A0A9Q0JAC5_9ROSI|nr:putative cyclic nucleotide-gated ion channel 7 [Turnera subulata]
MNTLDDLDSTISMNNNKKSSTKTVLFNLGSFSLTGGGKKNPSQSFRYRERMGSEGLLALGREVTRAYCLGIDTELASTIIACSYVAPWSRELRERVRRYDQDKWLETRGVDEESIVQNLPKDLRRDIKRLLCLNLVRRVPLFANMDESQVYTQKVFMLSEEGDPVDEMLFIIRGRLESVTTDGGRSGFFNRGFLKEGDFCGEELLTRALDPKASGSLPSSTRTVSALSEVEAFALEAEELKLVASQFRRLHSRQVQHTFRFYSQQWSTWASSFIQAAWRRYSRRKAPEQRQREELEEEEEDSDEEEYDDQTALVRRGKATSTFGATIFASRFAANLRGRGGLSSKSMKGLKSMKLKKPPEPEPDFSADE